MKIINLFFFVFFLAVLIITVLYVCVIRSTRAVFLRHEIRVMDIAGVLLSK